MVNTTVDPAPGPAPDQLTDRLQADAVVLGPTARPAARAPLLDPTKAIVRRYSPTSKVNTEVVMVEVAMLPSSGDAREVARVPPHGSVDGTANGTVTGIT